MARAILRMLTPTVTAMAIPTVVWGSMADIGVVGADMVAATMVAAVTVDTVAATVDTVAGTVAAQAAAVSVVAPVVVVAEPVAAVAAIAN